MAEFISVTAARAHRGVRLGTLRGTPSPWVEAVKGFLHVKQVPYVLCAQAPDDPPDALNAWSGNRGIPVFACDDEPLRDGWAAILLRIERLQPSPALVPRDAALRAEVFGVGHELCGEQGLGWSYRLLMLESRGRAGAAVFPGALQGALGAKYGLDAAALAGAEARVLDLLAMLDARLARTGWLVGDGLTAADIWWAAFANLMTPSAQVLAQCNPFIAVAYQCTNPRILAALTPRLRAHQQRIHAECMEVPVML